MSRLIYIYIHIHERQSAKKETDKCEDEKRGKMLGADCSIGIGAPSTLPGEDVQRLCPRARRIQVTSTFPSPIHLLPSLYFWRLRCFHPCLPPCHLIISCENTIFFATVFLFSFCLFSP